VQQQVPSFDLVVATVGRVEELEHFFTSLEFQTHQRFRVILVDQNPGPLLEHTLVPTGLDVLHLRSEPGLSHARNAALPHLAADVVAFPDDDCAYEQNLLAHVGGLLGDPTLDGVTGRSVDRSGHSSPSWKTDPAMLTPHNLWNRAASYTIFLRRHVVQNVGRFDEHLGLGSHEAWSSGEEIDYLIRAVKQGARIRYDPSIKVHHDEKSQDVAYRDGASVGYLLRKHGYPGRAVARMLVRPAGGTLLSLLRRDRERARFHRATLRGRLHGYRRASSEKSAS
jgi:GT2 family glycosyltransferase